MKKLLDNLRNFVMQRHITTHDVMLYLGFVGIAAIFWVLVAFSGIMQQEIEVKLEVVGKPPGITFIDEPPETITVTVRDKGTAFLRMMLNVKPKVKLNYTDFADAKNHSLVVPASRLMAATRRAFRREATIVKIDPTSFELAYTARPPKKVPVNYFDNLKVTPDRQFVIYGDIRVEPDSVLAYGEGENFANLTEATIAPFTEAGLDHKLDTSVPLTRLEGVRFKPMRVRLIVPVEPLIKRVENVPVQVRNVPEGVSVVVFPSTIKASYLLPQGIYKQSMPASIVAVVDYNTINRASKRAFVGIGEAPAVCREITLETDSVEYYIETK